MVAATTNEQPPADHHVSELLELHQQKELLRLVVVGSVDDGKSTLIGRLLHDTHGVYEDQLSAVRRASSQAGMEIDFSLFTDGLKAEREQGITIDVAYRYCATDQRKFIVADTPGHVQYTRNMATGASTANVGLILIDARLGVLQQSRRHAYIASLLGIPHLAVAVNKMDLRGYDRGVFEEIRRDFQHFAKQLAFKDVRFVPVSALEGDNIVAPSDRMPWYDGPTVLSYLETVPISSDRNLENFRFPVQYVLRPHLEYRGYAGEIASGEVRKGDPIVVLPSKRRTRVASIDTFEGSLTSAAAPQSVAITLEDEVDVSRGDMLVRPDDVPRSDTRFQATLVWMHEKSLDLDKSYLLKHTSHLVRVEVERVESRTNLDTLEAEPTETLGLNDIGKVRLRCHRPLYFDAYADNRRTGAFILIDSLHNGTLAAGVIEASSAPDPSQDLRPSGAHSQVSPREREERLGQRGGTVLINGPPGAGKSELAYAIERQLYDQGRVALVVDPADVGSSGDEEVAAHPERVSSTAVEIARRGAEVGWIVLLPFAAPTLEERTACRARLRDHACLSIDVTAPLDARRQRDGSGFYERAAHPEPVAAPSGDAQVDLSAEPTEDAARRIVGLLRERGLFHER